MSAAEKLKIGLEDLNLDLTPEISSKLLAYIELLAKWSCTYNLVSNNMQEVVIDRHILDSLAILPALTKFHIIADVGSGAGLPGLILAMARNDLTVHSVEAKQKKCAFQIQVKMALKLGNVNIHHQRVEHWHPQENPEALVSRGFANLAKFIALAGNLLLSGGKLFAMKGPRWKEELHQLPSGWRIFDCQKLHVPHFQPQRHLIILEKT